MSTKASELALMPSTPNIQDLPVDIMREIFEHVAAAEPAGYSNGGWKCHLGWISVTHVCRRWREISLSMTLLWADSISVFPKPSIADELLKRAHECLVHIDVCHEDYDFGSNRKALPLRWGVENISRARTVSCAAPLSVFIDGDPHIRAFCTNPPSTLQRIEISATNDLDVLVDPLPIVLCTPLLLSADLTNVIPHVSSTMTNLRNLTLFVDEWMSLSDPSPLLDALRGLGGLARLEITLQVFEIPAAEKYAVVPLDSLQSLKINMEGPQQPALVFLELISAPHAIDVLVVASSNWSAEFLAIAAAHQRSRSLYDALTISDGHLSLFGPAPQRATFQLIYKSWKGKGYEDLLTTLPSHSLDLSRFRFCELSLAYAHARRDKYDFGQELAVLGITLSRVNTLVLRGTSSTTASEMLTPNQSEKHPLFPALGILVLGGGIPASSWTSEARDVGEALGRWEFKESAIYGQDEGKEALQNRLILTGTWCEQEAWTHTWPDNNQSYRMQEYRSGFAVIDERFVVPRCNVCLRDSLY